MSQRSSGARRPGSPRRKTQVRKRRGLGGVVLVGAVLAAGAGLLWVSGRGGEAVPASAEATSSEVELNELMPPARDGAPSTVEDRSPERPEPPAPAPQGAQVAIVVDDLGRQLSEARRLVDLGIPVTFAVLPYEPRTLDVSRWLVERGHEVLCHLPMEPRSRANPGPGALVSDMTLEQIEIATLAALRAVPGARGVNNHMGSRLSEDPRRMSALMRALSREDVFFLDSRTSSESVAYESAVEAGLAAARRDIFLDSVRESEAIRAEFRRALQIARASGRAIAIGHPYDVTFEVLSEEIPLAVAAGFEFVAVSQLLDRSGYESL